MTQFYAIAAGGCIALLFIVHTLIRLSWLCKPCGALLRKYFLHPLLLRRHGLLGPWTRAQVAFALIYFAANAFCTCFRVSTASDVATRAGHLSLINMVPAYFGFHLSFICTLLGVSLPRYRLFHASTGTMSIILGVLHAIIDTAGKPSLGTRGSGQAFKLIVGCFLAHGLPPRLTFAFRRSFLWSRCVCFRRACFAGFRMSSSFAVTRVWPGL